MHKFNYSTSILIHERYTIIMLENDGLAPLLRVRCTRKNLVFPSICVEGNVKEIVQYRAKFPSVSEKSTGNFALCCTFPSIGNLIFSPVVAKDPPLNHPSKRRFPIMAEA